ncbi:MAG: OmpH family outer membrane protein [Pseudomonadota bacterium]
MNFRLPVIASVLALIAAFASAHVSAGPGLKVAIVDLQRAASQSPHADAARKKIDKEFRKRDRDLISKQKGIRKREESLVKRRATMSESQLAKANQELRRMRREFQRELSEFNEDRAVRNNEELQKLQRVVIDETQKLASAEKYDLVLIRGVVVFADERKLDITDRVLGRLKTRFKQGR